VALAVIGVVSLALVAGAVWGTCWRLTRPVEGFVVALAGGALIVAVVLELVGPALEVAPYPAVGAAVLAGAVVFALVSRWTANRFGRDSGTGLLAAVSLDGVPENLALGVALISATPLQVAALSGSIFLSNLPEAAGGARDMKDDHDARTVLGVWCGTAVLLAAAAAAGYLLLGDVPASLLGLLQAFAGGAVVSSLADTVFPDAFSEDSYAAGVASALGLVLALGLDQLA